MEGRATAAVAAVGLAALALGIWLHPGSSPEPVPLEVEADTGGKPEAAAPAPPARALAVEPARHGSVSPGETLALSLADLRAGEPVELDLLLPDPLPGAGPMPLRVYAEDGTRREGIARPPSGEGLSARVEIDPEWLSPGRYILEIATPERSHFPLRRYVLEVR